MKKKRIDENHFKQYVNLSGFLRHGSAILFTETRVQDDSYTSDLCLLDAETAERKTLLKDADIGCCHWDADGSVIFTAALEEADRELQRRQIPLTVFYKLDPETRKTELLFRVHKDVADFHKAGEDQYFLLCSDLLRDDVYLARANGDWEAFSRIKAEESDYFIAEEVPFWTNESGFCDGTRGRIFLYEDGTLTQLSPDDLHVTAMSGFGSQYLAYTGMRSGGVQNTTGRLYRFDLQTKETVAMDASDTYVYTYVQAVSEDEILVCRNDRRLHGEYQDEYIDLIRIADGSFSRQNAETDYHIYDTVTCDITYLSSGLNKPVRLDGGTYFLATERESSNLFFWADGQALPEAVTRETGKVIDYEVTGDKVYIIAMRGLGGTELYVCDRKTGEEQRISDYNTALESVYEYAPVQRLPYVNSAGTELQGWYLKPLDYTEGKTYPAVLFIHGGPQSAYGEIFQHDMQLMAARGCGVLFCNPTGSEGRGGDFADIRKQYGTIDMEDLVGFTRYAADALPWIDRGRLGITGGSYGGIMTNWIIGHTDLFKAAVSDRGSCNNLSDFGLSDIGVSFCLDTYGTTPWEDPGSLWDASPLKYAPNIKTPTLFIHGAADYRCTCDSALQMHAALTYFGTPSKVVAFKGEKHGLCRTGKPAHRARRLQEIVQWFDRYLK